MMHGLGVMATRDLFVKAPCLACLVLLATSVALAGAAPEVQAKSPTVADIQAAIRALKGGASCAYLPARSKPWARCRCRWA